MRKPVIVIGCPRSGTTFMKRLLSDLGMSVGHGSFYPDGTVDWEIVHVFPAMDLSGFEVLHQVRHPLKAISSIHTHREECRKRFRRYIDVEGAKPCSLEEDMVFWVKWNELCEKYANWRYRVEDINSGGEVYQELCRRCCVKPRKVKLLSEHYVNTRHPEQYGMKALRSASKKWSSRVVCLAEKYGYTI
jgi:hypothetical protein